MFSILDALLAEKLTVSTARIAESLIGTPMTVVFYREEIEGLIAALRDAQRSAALSGPN